MQPTSESEVAFSREHEKTVPHASEHVSIKCVPNIFMPYLKVLQNLSYIYSS
jgi:hypothetical protein